ncbi:hypothetical protein FDECE_6947 [Fusarium decemcellulare]|nr:hypothetical protein FDECE_6947 [Fusarium decemcellulare]
MAGRSSKTSRPKYPRQATTIAEATTTTYNLGGSAALMRIPLPSPASGADQALQQRHLSAPLTLIRFIPLLHRTIGGPSSVCHNSSTRANIQGEPLDNIHLEMQDTHDDGQVRNYAPSSQPYAPPITESRTRLPANFTTQPGENTAVAKDIREDNSSAVGTRAPVDDKKAGPINPEDTDTNGNKPEDVLVEDSNLPTSTTPKHITLTECRAEFINRNDLKPVLAAELHPRSDLRHLVSLKEWPCRQDDANLDDDRLGPITPKDVGPGDGSESLDHKAMDSSDKRAPISTNGIVHSCQLSVPAPSNTIGSRNDQSHPTAAKGIIEKTGLTTRANVCRDSGGSSIGITTSISRNREKSGSTADTNLFSHMPNKTNQSIQQASQEVSPLAHRSQIFGPSVKQQGGTDQKISQPGPKRSTHTFASSFLSSSPAYAQSSSTSNQGGIFGNIHVPHSSLAWPRISPATERLFTPTSNASASLNSYIHTNIAERRCFAPASVAWRAEATDDAPRPSPALNPTTLNFFNLAKGPVRKNAGDLKRGREQQLWENPLTRPAPIAQLLAPHTSTPTKVSSQIGAEDKGHGQTQDHAALSKRGSTWLETVVGDSPRINRNMESPGTDIQHNQVACSMP